MVEPVAFDKNNPQPQILIVDSDAATRSNLNQLFELRGCAVTEAECGYAALTLLQRHIFDLMVLDLHLPELNGVEIMGWARQLQPELLIIILTAHATLDNAIAAVRLDAADYLRKPASFDKINQAVQRAFQKRAEQYRLFSSFNASRTPHHSEFTRNAPPSVTPVHERFIRVPPVTLDCKKRVVFVEDNQPRLAKLTEGELAILTTLLHQPNQVLSCKQLVEQTWGYPTDEFEAKGFIRPYIFRLRSKIEVDNKAPQLICTIRLRGYLFAIGSEKKVVEFIPKNHETVSASSDSGF